MMITRELQVGDKVRLRNSPFVTWRQRRKPGVIFRGRTGDSPMDCYGVTFCDGKYGYLNSLELEEWTEA